MTRSLLFSFALFACLASLSGCGGGGEAEFVQPGPEDGPTEQEIAEQQARTDEDAQRFQEAYGRPGN